MKPTFITPFNKAPFVREERYYVLKISDMRKYLSPEKQETVRAIAEKLNAGRTVDGKTVLQAVVVEHDWPEYERVWQMIETRVATTRRNFLNCNNDRRFWPIPEPKPWVTLTDEEVQEIGNEVHRSMPDDADELMELLATYHEIESRLCEKNMPVQQPEQETVAWPLMGYGNVAIGGGKQPDGTSCLMYLDMDEMREIDADTSDLFPIGTEAPKDKLLACIRFKDGAAIQQTIDVLREMQVEIGYATPPQRQPLTDEEVIEGREATDPSGEDVCSWSFAKGVEWAETKHGITGEQKCVN